MTNSHSQLPSETEIIPKQVLPEIARYLATKPKKIGVIISNYPLGHGDQTANAKRMMQLRKMGFEGIFRVYYSETVKDKIKRVFNLPSAFNKANNVFSHEKSEFVCMESDYFMGQVDKGLLEPIQLGISGAFDMSGFCGTVLLPAVQKGRIKRAYLKDLVQSPHYIVNNALTYNVADFFQFKTVVIFSAYTGQSRINPGTIIWKEKQSTPIYLPDQETFLQNPLYSLAEAKDFLKTDSEGQEFAKTKPAISTVINLLEQQRAYFFPLYGYPLEFSKRGKDYTHNLINILRAVKRVQTKASLVKPIIIMTFFSIPDELKKRITELFRQTEFTKVASEVVSLQSSETANKLMKMSGEKIVVLEMGNMPSKVFEGIYFHQNQNVFAMVREGANALQPDLPQIRCIESGDANWIEYEFLAPSDPILKEWINLQKAICQGKPLSHAEVDELANAWIGFKNETSKMYRLFTWIKSQVSLPKYERVQSALNGVVGSFLQNTTALMGYFYQGKSRDQIPNRQKASAQSVPFDSGAFDSEIQLHPRTGKPVFKYRVFKDGQEVGSVLFYNHPLVCKSKEADGHNLYEFVGVLKNMPIKLDLIDEICESLPPNFFKERCDDVYHGVTNGLIRGSSRLLEEHLESRAYSRVPAVVMAKSYLYTMTFLLKFCEHLCSLESQGFWQRAEESSHFAMQNVACLAAFDMLSHLVEACGEKLKKCHWKKLGFALKQIGFFGVYAHSTYQNGPASVTTTAVVGGITEMGILRAGKALMAPEMKPVAPNFFSNTSSVDVAPPASTPTSKTRKKHR